MMSTDTAGRAFITHEEGEVLHTYKCAAGVNTIGVGHTGQDAAPGRTITHELSQILLSKDLARFEASVNRLVRVPLTQHQFNALVSFEFNLGEGSLAKSSLLRVINSGVFTPNVITISFRVWNKVNGVLNTDIRARRMREAALFLS